jgi:hypothetical protein
MAERGGARYSGVKKELTYVYHYRHRPHRRRIYRPDCRLDAWQETLYPAESNHLLDLSQLPPQTVIALAIRSPGRGRWLRGYRPQ